MALAIAAARHGSYPPRATRSLTQLNRSWSGTRTRTQPRRRRSAAAQRPHPGSASRLPAWQQSALRPWLSSRVDTGREAVDLRGRSAADTRDVDLRLGAVAIQVAGGRVPTLRADARDLREVVTSARAVPEPDRAGPGHGRAGVDV